MITHERRKVTLIDYCLLPDKAIVDPTLMVSLPPDSTADTGLDALTHALEGAVSIFSSPYTDAFCVQAVSMIFEWLPRAFRDGTDIEARTGMADAPRWPVWRSPTPSSASTTRWRMRSG